MLIRVLREYLRPYYGPLALVLLLQLVANAAALYLPTLNARIIDDGITPGVPSVAMRPRTMPFSVPARSSQATLTLPSGSTVASGTR